MTQRGDDVSNICRFLPKLTVNGQFMRDFMAEKGVVSPVITLQNAHSFDSPIACG
jgi:hypothetical protein